MNQLKHVQFGFEIEARGATPALVNQVHGTTIHNIRNQSDYGVHLSGAFEGDGVITRESGLDMYVFTADCVPMLLFTEDPEGPVAAIHSGWRGARSGIPDKAVQLMGVPPSDLHVIFGPCIRGTNYAVKQDFVDSFAKAGRPVDAFIQNRNGDLYFDLPDYLFATQLKDIPESNRHLDYLKCTFESTLPSYRRDGNTDNRIRSWIRKAGQ